MDDDTASKREARDGARARRRSLTPGEREAAAEAVAQRALELPGVAGARAVLAYVATAEELDPAPLVAALRDRGAAVAYPRVCGPGTLALHWCDEESALAPGYCGIAEPAVDAPQAADDVLDLVIVPGAAFDERCGRLGMGGGFYDRLLPRLTPGALAVGLAFDEQVVPEVPTESHDVPLAAVVTPTRTILPGG